uniref:Zinc finger protein AEBP2 n=1 Tax=Schistocephalus solidus TaxID=70667 RepID=A0A0X3P9E1_SCHSO
MLDCLKSRSSALPRTSSRILSKRRCDPVPLRSASVNSSWDQECPKKIGSGGVQQHLPDNCFGLCRDHELALSVLEALGDSFSRMPKSFPGSSSSSLSSNSCALSVASSSSNDCPTSTNMCKWDGCVDCHDDASSGLLSHIQTSHVYPQLSSRKTQYTCLWRGCKVYGQPSVSSNWLSRHVLRHSEARGKPFQCIFDRCVLRFSSTALLERHIARDHSQENGTACTPESLDLTSKPSASQRSVCSSPVINKHIATVKSCSRKTLRKRRKFRCYRVRRTDFYDTRSKAIIRNRLILDRILREVSLLPPSQSPPQSDARCRSFDLITTESGGSAEPESENSDDDGRKLCANLTLPFPLTCNSTVAIPSRSPSTRCLRSSGPATPSLSKPSSSSHSSDLTTQPCKPDGSHVKLLLTVPHTFVGQRISHENRTEYLVKWQGDLCSGVAPVMWVKDEEVRVAARLDRL